MLTETSNTVALQKPKSLQPRKYFTLFTRQYWSENLAGSYAGVQGGAAKGVFLHFIPCLKTGEERGRLSS